MNQNFGKTSGVYTRACSKCGGDLGHRYGKYRYCLACHAAYMRATRPKHRELPPEQRMRANTRALSKHYLKRGAIKRERCLICGNKNSQMHHEDYSKPLEVIWICRPCHLKHHLGINEGITLTRVMNLLTRINLLTVDQ